MIHRMDFVVVKLARVFLSGLQIMMYNFGKNKKIRITKELVDAHMHMVVTWKKNYSFFRKYKKFTEKSCKLSSNLKIFNVPKNW